MTMLPITLATAAICGLIYVFLAFRVVQGRVAWKINLGDGANDEMVCRIRTHANFSEYVPIALILLGLLEMSGANRTALVVLAVAFVTIRVLHIVGMQMRPLNPFRVLGAGGTFAIIAIQSLWGLATLI